MNQNKHYTTVTLGIAIFSMFFGAGNVIFPLALGIHSGEQFGVAFFGLVLTSIGAPLLGLYAALLYKGNCQAFFERLGKWPTTFFLWLLILALGPIGAMPRCMTLSFSALTPIFPNLTLTTFTLICGALMLVCILKRQLFLSVLGKVLSPLLIIMLAVITYYGLQSTDASTTSSLSSSAAFFLGIDEGYQTMDLLASLLFSITIWHLVEDKICQQANKQKIIYGNCLKASLIAALLLTLVYIGLGYVAKTNAGLLNEISPDRLLSTLSFTVMGPKLGIISNLTIALACFTTIISLAVAATELLWQTHKEPTPFNLNERQFYVLGIIFITLITLLVANLGFATIAKIISPIVRVCYPAIITLTVCNILYKKFDFKWVRLPVYSVLLITLCVVVTPLVWN